ncbi:MAG: hypothetical protein IPO22_23960, partial [Anaerolineales bacterium]|nr:hypothetical protein [Anaerolineales bacterium]
MSIHHSPPAYDPRHGSDGEGDWELFLRAGQALHSLLKREPARYLIVSHGGLLNQVMHAVVGSLREPTMRARASALETRLCPTHILPVSTSLGEIDKLNDNSPHWLDAD